MKTIAILLAAVGIIMIAYTGFTYVTTEKVVDLGPLQVSAQKEHPVQWSPIVGGIFLASGAIIFMLSKKAQR